MGQLYILLDKMGLDEMAINLIAFGCDKRSLAFFHIAYSIEVIPDARKRLMNFSSPSMAFDPFSEVGCLEVRRCLYESKKGTFLAES